MTPGEVSEKLTSQNDKIRELQIKLDKAIEALKWYEDDANNACFEDFSEEGVYGFIEDGDVFVHDNGNVAREILKELGEL